MVESRTAMKRPMATQSSPATCSPASCPVSPSHPSHPPETRSLPALSLYVIAWVGLGNRHASIASIASMRLVQRSLLRRTNGDCVARADVRARRDIVVTLYVTDNKIYLFITKYIVAVKRAWRIRCRSYGEKPAHLSARWRYTVALRRAFLLSRQGSGIHQRMDGK